MKVLVPILLMLISSHVCAVLIECNMLIGIGLGVLENVHDGTSDTETYEMSEDESEEDTASVSEDLSANYRLSAYVQFMNKPTTPYYLEIPTPPPE